MQAERDTFGPRLKLERERRGIALKDISESTKIKESLFAELERNDFSKWPQGIFRRAHLCAYLSAIGLPPQPVLAEFFQLFPDEPHVEQPAESRACDPAGTTQPPVLKANASSSDLADRIWVLGFDLALVCLGSSALAAATSLSVWQAMAFVGVSYSAFGSACFAKSVGAYVQQEINAVRRDADQQPVAVQPLARKVELIASKRPRTAFSPNSLYLESEIEDRRASA
jgi:transcriptional regulator with XRE-family HTH domain